MNGNHLNGHMNGHMNGHGHGHGQPAALLARYVDRPPNSFLVLSYNMLCHSAKHLGHFSLSEEAFPWERRWALFEREFTQYDADIICVQEVNKLMYLSLLQYFGAWGYEGLHIAKHLPEDPEEWRWDAATLGQAIFVRHSRFEIVASTSTLLRDLFTEEESKAKDEHGLADVIKSRAEGCLCVALREVGSGQKVVVACAHPTYYYTAPQFATKPTQISLTLRAVGTFAAACGVQPSCVVLAGDWNSTPENGGYALLTTGVLDVSHAEHPASNGWALPVLRSDLGALRSAYATMGAEPVFTTKTTNFTDCLDYIFVGSALEVVDVIPLPPDLLMSHCPNEEWASDHLAVGAFLRLRAK